MGHAATRALVPGRRHVIPGGSARLRGYSMTWCACASSDEGMVAPSAFAVLRSMTGSNFEGCSTASSAGLAPRTVLLFCEAVRDGQALPRHPAALAKRLLEVLVKGSAAGDGQVPEAEDLVRRVSLGGERHGVHTEGEGRDDRRDAPGDHGRRDVSRRLHRWADLARRHVPGPTRPLSGRCP